jgi:hypothetical protein
MRKWKLVAAGAVAAALLLLGALGLQSCARRADGPELADAGAGKRVLIAARSSAFKDALVDKLLEGLKARRCGARAIDLGKLDPKAAEGFDAVVIVDRCWAWSLSRSVERFLAAAPKERRIVLVVTSGNGQWRPKGAEPDAVTCASKPGEGDRAAAEALAKLAALLEKR